MHAFAVVPSRPVPSRVDEKVQFQPAPHFMALLRSLLRSRASTVRSRARDITRVVSSDASSAAFEFGDAQARYYDDVLVDGIFKPWTESMFETSRPVAGDRVLDVATGTGVVAREIARAVGSTVRRRVFRERGGGDASASRREGTRARRSVVVRRRPMRRARSRDVRAVVDRSTDRPTTVRFVERRGR